MKEQVLDFLKDFFQTEDKNPETFKNIFQSLDSLDAIDLIYQVEDKFNIKIEKTGKIESVDDLIQIIKSNQVAV